MRSFDTLFPAFSFIPGTLFGLTFHVHSLLVNFYCIHTIVSILDFLSSSHPFPPSRCWFASPSILPSLYEESTRPFSFRSVLEVGLLE